MTSRYEEIWNRIENCQTSLKGEKLREIEVRLICDLMNEDMKKSFNKTVNNIKIKYVINYKFFLSVKID